MITITDNRDKKVGLKVDQLQCGHTYQLAGQTAWHPGDIVVGVSASFRMDGLALHGVALSGDCWHSGDTDARFLPIEFNIDVVG